MSRADIRKMALAGGAVFCLLGLGLSRFGMIGHMTGHMLMVAVASPLLAITLRDGRFNPAVRWPGLVMPMPMMLLELVTVWGWHLPMARRIAAQNFAGTVVEQACFLAAGVLLWSAAIHADRRAAGIGALLLTSMHMTLLGVLIGLAPRPLYDDLPQRICGLGRLSDQQLGGVAMLAIGAVSYLIGGLALLAGLLKGGSEVRP